MPGAMMSQKIKTELAADLAVGQMPEGLLPSTQLPDGQAFAVISCPGGTSSALSMTYSSLENTTPDGIPTSAPVMMISLLRALVLFACQAVGTLR